MRRLAARAVLLIAGLMALGVQSTRAQAFDPDEARDLRLVKSGPDVALTWVAPPTAPADYIVRRCTLAALRGGAFGAPYFGNCVATGVLPTSWSEPSPLGAVFYLVSGQIGGVEGSLGSSWNGQIFVPRTPTDCTAPEMPMPLTLVVSLDTPQLVCGTQIAISFPPGALTYSTSACSGLLSGPAFAGAGNETSPGHLAHVCASVAGIFGSGEIIRVEFQRNECPILESGIHVTRCTVLVGNPDCGSSASLEQACQLTVL